MRSVCEQAGLQWGMTAAGMRFFFFYYSFFKFCLSLDTQLTFLFFLGDGKQMVNSLCNQREVDFQAMIAARDTSWMVAEY